MNLETLTAISPLDGRYRKRTAALAPIVSEFGLMRYRVRIEAQWFEYLASRPEVSHLPALDSAQAAQVEAVWRRFDVSAAAVVRRREAETNHDVKAVEYFVKDAIGRIDGLAEHIEFVHFGCTSEDVNNLAYALLLADAREVLAQAMARLIDALRQLARPLTGLAMVARTHGQAASPTTVGKELANFVVRLERQRQLVLGVRLLGKMNGAVGNYNAHAAAYPAVDWPRRCREFVTGLGLGFNELTTQIEPHDYMAELFHGLIRFNQVLLDFDRDIWGYVALGHFRQRRVEGETGSSTMPHKVNPIDFENSEGNVGLANAVLAHLADKLTVSRWQRDLSDSTALRSIGTAFGYCLVAYDSACRGIARLAVDGDALGRELDGAWEVLAEAVQTVMRATGCKEPYERLKRLTRGQRMDESVYRALLDALDLPAATRQKLLALTPANYTGLAERLARAALQDEPSPADAAGVRVFEAPWPTHGQALASVRRTVFVDEQGIAEEEEWDGEDETSRHFLAESSGGAPIGAVRLLPAGQIGRMAVLAPWRRHGIGARLLALAVDTARQAGFERIFLHAQVTAVRFYERAGFVASGDSFLEAGIQHTTMTLPGQSAVANDLPRA